LASPDQFWSIVNNWQKQVATKGFYSHHENEIEHAIEREFMMAQETVQFATNDISTFSHIDIKAPPSGAPESNKLFHDADTELRIIRLYFKDQVRVPAPDTFSQALDLRQNARILQWRNQIQQWSKDLRGGNISENYIKEQIDEANGYIEGTNFGTRLLPELATTVVLPVAAAYELFLGQHKFAHIIGIGILGVEIVRAWSELAKRAVQLPDALQYKWLLIKSE
jgi:hypothetical protein